MCGRYELKYQYSHRPSCVENRLAAILRAPTRDLDRRRGGYMAAAAAQKGGEGGSALSAPRSPLAFIALGRARSKQVYSAVTYKTNQKRWDMI